LARKVVLCEADPLGTTAATTSTQHQHIPDFLPGFPAPHTYQQSDAFTQFETDPEKVRAIKLQQTRAVEDSLLKLHEAKGLQLNSAANSQHAGMSWRVIFFFCISSALLSTNCAMGQTL
jgi:hypothetical protein